MKKYLVPVTLAFIVAAATALVLVGFAGTHRNIYVTPSPLTREQKDDLVIPSADYIGGGDCSADRATGDLYLEPDPYCLVHRDPGDLDPRVKVVKNDEPQATSTPVVPPTTVTPVPPTTPPTVVPPTTPPTVVPPTQEPPKVDPTPKPENKDNGNHYGNDKPDNNGKDNSKFNGDDTREDFEQTKDETKTNNGNGNKD